MAKYSFKFKQKVVQAYLSGEGGYCYLTEKYNIGNKSNLQKWVKAYEEFGVDGLVRSRKNKTYSFDFKLNVVELYLTTEVSYQELALTIGINNPPLISKWVNDFHIAGLDALKPKKRGRQSIMKRPENVNQLPEENKKSNSDYLKQLEEENLKLRIENAYLKEVRRLRLEGKPQKVKRESSTASEDHSN
jgi:transposase